VRILVAPDAFKGTLTAIRAAEIIRDALPAVDPAARAMLVPLADGGEGTVEALHRAWGGEMIESVVPGPAGMPVVPSWLHCPERGVAVAESASCLGHGLVSASRRDPLRARSTGLGLLPTAIAAAAPRRILVGVGGTATNDGGLGMASALGWSPRPPDESDADIGHTLSRIELLAPPPRSPLADIAVIALVDVDNPLCGPQGTTAVYGPQKGVRAEDVPRVDAAMGHWSAVVRRDVRGVDPASPGAGAGGGLGFALAAFAGAELCSGAEAVLEAAGFDDLLRYADLVITGEGRIDAQTARGKVVCAVAAAAARAGVPVVAIGGRAQGAPGDLAKALGVALVVEAAPRRMSDADALLAAERTLRDAVIRNAAAIRFVAEKNIQPRGPEEDVTTV
jgi:glycerate 2-kinase